MSAASGTFVAVRARPQLHAVDRAAPVPTIARWTSPPPPELTIPTVAVLVLAQLATLATLIALV